MSDEQPKLTYQQILTIVDQIGFDWDGWGFRCEPLGIAVCSFCRRIIANTSMGWAHVSHHGRNMMAAHEIVPMTEHYFLQSVFHRPDTWNDGIMGEGRGRKWLISPHMTESEIVLTALKAVITNLEHEARENFTYKGKHIFAPHPSIDALLAIADETEVRAPMPAQTELDLLAEGYIEEADEAAAFVEAALPAQMEAMAAIEDDDG